jgi:hypothetical protein
MGNIARVIRQMAELVSNEFVSISGFDQSSNKTGQQVHGLIYNSKIAKLLTARNSSEYKNTENYIQLSSLVLFKLELSQCEMSSSAVLPA